MVATNNVALPNGTLIGAYRVDALLGAGAWTITYAASDRQTREKVALREYFPELLCQRAEGGRAVVPVSQQERSELSAGITEFMRWARTVATVRHDNVASVRRVLETNGTAYVATAMVDGAPLDALLRPEEALDPQELDEVLPGLLGGLEAIHHAGLYHRAIHPGAIFIQHDATPVLDLPAADWQVEDPDVELAAHVRAYASPELLVREDFGPWSDVYSVSATLFRLVTGAPPPAADARAFPNANRPDTIAHMLDSAPGSWRPGLLELISRGMALSVKQRPPSLESLRALLDQRVIEEPDTIPTRPHRRSGGATTQRIAGSPQTDVGETPPQPGLPLAGISTATPSEPPAAVPDLGIEPDPFNLPTAPGPDHASPDSGAAHHLDLDRPTRPNRRGAAQPVAPAAQVEAPGKTAPAAAEKATDTSAALKKPQSPPVSSVIYRNGKPEEISHPPEDGPSGPPGEDGAAASIAPARFTLFHPQAVGPRTWGMLVVYMHESGIASIIARQEADRRDGPLTDRAQPRDDSHMLVRPGAEMLVVPRLRGGRVNPPWARVQWVENFHRLEFRVAAAPDHDPNRVGELEGSVDFYAGTLLVGETPFKVNVTPKPEPSEPLTAKSMSFSRVLPGYAAEDVDMVDRFAAAAESVNMPFLQHILDLRAAGKDRGIRRLISRAERFQLCWSRASCESPRLRREWEEAKDQGKPDLIRICSWDNPMPAPPSELKDAPVQRLPKFDT